FYADIRPDAGREHLDAVDDRLREDVAPTGHLEDATELVVDEVAARTALPRQEEDAFRERFPQLVAECGERPKRRRVGRLPEVRLHRLGGEPQRLVAVRRAAEKGDVVGRLDQLLYGQPCV